MKEQPSDFDEKIRRYESIHNSIWTGEDVEFKKAPCMTCTDRFLGCHGKCEQYQAFRKERDRLNDKKYKRQDLFFSSQNVTKKRRNTLIEDFKYRRK